MNRTKKSKPDMIHDARYMIYEKGQMMVEMMVAMSILVVGALGMVGLLNQSLGLSKIVTSQYVASNLAMEGIEAVKNLIDANNIRINNGELVAWNEGLIDNGDIGYEVLIGDVDISLRTYQDEPLQFHNDSGLYNYSNANETIYTRKITIETIPNLSNDYDQIRVNSIVSWKIRGFSNDINIEDHFFNWRKQLIEAD